VRKTATEFDDSIHGEIILKSILSKLTIPILAAGLLLTQAGCTESEQEPVTDNPALASPVPDGAVRGTVLETMDSGGYTYVLMEAGEEKRWVATQQVAVAVGDVVQTTLGMAMSNFESASLNRTFDVVYFVDGLENLSSSRMPPMPEGHPALPLPEGHPIIDSAGEEQAAVAAVAEVAELEPGQNIAWVYANKDTLAGQSISLRGTVVKYNDGILGRNFIHIQDGSGDAAEGSYDLTVTSNDTTAVGETVVVTGTVTLNKDFGAGYAFPVLVEDASITKE
jgi:hypothetical protein